MTSLTRPGFILLHVSQTELLLKYEACKLEAERGTLKEIFATRGHGTH